MTLDTEAREEIYPLNMDALFHNGLRREHGIQPAGNQGNGLNLFFHVVRGRKKAQIIALGREK
jgi:hypothetical protein